ncbi:MAG: M28 family peptidase, partial [Longimonas sp.]|uniref:M28 family peptidase n=1 Tax=Longimonas sp. TaxID=2039626 RepID=UPI00334A0B5E
NYINNGADDNGSGTVATLALAQAFKQAKSDGYGPRRSILFLNVTAEEKGLLGSAYYADEEPVFPLEQTVANLNLDMIGRVDPSYPELPDSNYVYIIGGDLISDDLDAINRLANERTGINYTLHERYNDPNDPQALYRRSDQWNFGKHNIPFIFYFSGLHDDYHDVGDEAHKIDYERMAERTRLVFATTWQLANQDARPAVSGEGFD